MTWSACWFRRICHKETYHFATSYPALSYGFCPPMPLYRRKISDRSSTQNESLLSMSECLVLRENNHPGWKNMTVMPWRRPGGHFFEIVGMIHGITMILLLCFLRLQNGFLFLTVISLSITHPNERHPRLSSLEISPPNDKVSQIEQN